MNFGAGDRGRTGDVQLGNFVSNLVDSSFSARTYPTISALTYFFRSLVISTGFTPSAFVLGTFWERGLSATPLSARMHVGRSNEPLRLRIPNRSAEGRNAFVLHCKFSATGKSPVRSSIASTFKSKFPACAIRNLQSKASYPTERHFFTKRFELHKRRSAVFVNEPASITAAGFAMSFSRIRRGKKACAQKASPHHTFSTPNVFRDPSEILPRR